MAPWRDSDAYPVVYMFDGHNLFRDEWATYGTCWGLADFLARWEKQVIVVAPECDREGNNRLIEYAPYDMDIPPCGLVRGRGAELMDWLLGELKPFVDKAWPTMPFRETTAVGGSSMGGLMAMFAVLRHNRWISKAACLSSSFRFCPEEIVSEAENADVDPDTRVYLSWGSAECASHAALTAATDLNLRLSHILTEKGARTYPYLHVAAATAKPTGPKRCPASCTISGWNEKPPRPANAGRGGYFCAWAARVRPVAAFMPAAR